MSKIFIAILSLFVATSALAAPAAKAKKAKTPAKVTAVKTLKDADKARADFKAKHKKLLDAQAKGPAKPKPIKRTVKQTKKK